LLRSLESAEPSACCEAPGVRRVTSRFWWRAADVVAVLVIALVAYKLWSRAYGLTPAVTRAPAVSLERLSGSRFESAAARGRLVYLDFFASWCGPCRASLPLVEHFAAAHPRVTVVPVDVGEDRLTAERFARDLRLGDVALDAQQQAASAYGVSGFPTIVVIDAAGYVRARWTGYFPLIEQMLAGAAAALATPGARFPRSR
jgi:thiol-disulfide isomerase/thioredoxin